MIHTTECERNRSRAEARTVTQAMEPAHDIGERFFKELADFAPVMIQRSGTDTENAAIHCGSLDAGVELLTKPFTQVELARKLRKILAR